MFEPEQKTTTPESSLAEELLQLYDDFALFSEYHAFFCDAFTGVVSSDGPRDISTIHGINRCSCWMKARLAELLVRLKALQDKSRTIEVG